MRLPRRELKGLVGARVEENSETMLEGVPEGGHTRWEEQEASWGRAEMAPPGPQGRQEAAGPRGLQTEAGVTCGRQEGRLDHSLQGARGQAVPALPLNAGGATWQFLQGIPARVSGFGTLQAGRE